MSNSTTTTVLNPSDAIAAFGQGEVGRNRLFEAFAKHENWLLPLQQTPDGPAARSFRGEDGALFTVLFSSRQALERSRESQGQQAVGEEIHEIRGLDLFANHQLLETYAWLLIDPDGPAALKLVEEQFPEAREWAGMYKVDNAIDEILRDVDVDANLDILHTHTPWIVIASGPDKRLALVPDAEQRKLGAVFTSFNAADRYVQALSQHLDDGVKLQPVILPADKLFTELSRLDIMGAVVNCFGPTPGRAFSKAFVDSVG